MVRRWSFLLAVALLFVAGLSPAAAQSTKPYPLMLIPDGAAGPSMPTNTVVSYATDADGNVIDTCLWSIGTKPSACLLDVPRGATVTVSVDESTLPAGVVVTDNDQVFTVPMKDPMSIGDLVFHFEYADAPAPTQTPVAAPPTDQTPAATVDASTEAPALPRTGSGPVFAQILHVIEQVFGDK